MPDSKSKYKEDASNSVLGNDVLVMSSRRVYIDKADGPVLRHAYEQMVIPPTLVWLSKLSAHSVIVTRPH